MRILHISNSFTQEAAAVPNKIGGAEVYAGRICQKLTRRGHSVIVVTQRPFEGIVSLFPRMKESDGIMVYSFYPLNIFSIYRTHSKPVILKALWRLVDLINPIPALMVGWVVRKEKPNLIHSHILHGFSPYFLLRLFSLMRLPVVQTIHSYGYLCLRCNLLHPNGATCNSMNAACRVFMRISRALVGATINQVVSPSRFTLSLYERFGFFPQAGKRVLVNGIDTYERNPHHKEGDSFIIFFAGRLVKEKGAETLVKAFKKILSVRARLFIAGEGSQERYLRSLAGGDTRINFLGKCSWDRLKEYYSKSDVTVVPSLFFEILGNVALESMSCGAPVVASRIGGLSELIKEGENGFLFEPGNVDELTTILNSLIAAAAQCEEMGRSAFAFSKGFNLEAHINAIEKVYAETRDIFTRN